MNCPVCPSFTYTLPPPLFIFLHLHSSLLPCTKQLLTEEICGLRLTLKSYFLRKNTGKRMTGYMKPIAWRGARKTLRFSASETRQSPEEHNFQIREKF